MIAALAPGHRLSGCALPLADMPAIRAYLAASGDDNPLHHDPEVARRAGFAQVLVPGMMIAGQVATLLAKILAGRRIEGLETRFVVPVVAGSALHLEGRVVAVRADGAAILRLTVRLDGQVAVLGEAVVRAD